MADTPLAALLTKSIAHEQQKPKPAFYSQEHKLHWAQSIKDVSLRLYQVASQCPHGEAGRECERCWLLFSMVDQLEKLAGFDAERTNRDYAPPEREWTDAETDAFMRQWQANEKGGAK